MIFSIYGNVNFATHHVVSQRSDLTRGGFPDRLLEAAQGIKSLYQ